ncbi:MAG: hypothetical protein R3E48_02770 [Burkholderiaceae bacterium]
MSVRLPPIRMLAPLFCSGASAGHDVDAVHAAHAVAILDLEALLVVDPDHGLARAVDHFLVLLEHDGLGRAAGDHVVDQFGHAVLVEPLARQGLVCAHVVAPGADDGEVRALHRVHAVVRAARELELELVGQRRAMDVVEEVVDDRALGLALVVAGLLATGRADA